MATKTGVLQGKILGSLLSIVYINHLTEVVDCLTNLFADDTSLYSLGSILETALTPFNSIV